MDITYFNLHQRICLEYVEYLFPFYDDYTTLPCGDNEDYKVFLPYNIPFTMVRLHKSFITISKYRSNLYSNINTNVRNLF